MRDVGHVELSWSFAVKGMSQKARRPQLWVAAFSKTLLI
jgi:hypothetical protein